MDDSPLPERPYNRPNNISTIKKKRHNARMDYLSVFKYAVFIIDKQVSWGGSILV